MNPQVSAMCVGRCRVSRFLHTRTREEVSENPAPPYTPTPPAEIEDEYRNAPDLLDDYLRDLSREHP